MKSMQYNVFGKTLRYPSQAHKWAGLPRFSLKFASTPWLVAARQSNWGALVFGHGFHLSNLVCYTLGVTLGAGIEAAFRYQRRN